MSPTPHPTFIFSPLDDFEGLGAVLVPVVPDAFEILEVLEVLEVLE